MIKANEYRLDNLVNAPKIGACTVNGIQVHSDGEIYVWVVTNSMEFQHRVNVKNLSPIPLTPEILEKAGFERGVMPFTGELGYSKSNQGAGYFFGLVDNGDNGYMFHNPHFNRNFKYLHQLQNLYFALTGEELQIQLS